MNEEARQLVSVLGLSPLQSEGGFYARTWTGPAPEGGGRASGSSILFLLTPDVFSAFHRLRTDEVWHFHGGDPAELIRLDPRTGLCAVLALGGDPLAGRTPQAVVPAGVWQAARVLSAPGSLRGWSLLGCTLAPAWDPGEFELGRREALLAAFPDHAAWIGALTRQTAPAVEF